MFIVSPYDAFAVEEGVQLKEANGGEVVLYSVGNSTWQTQHVKVGLQWVETRLSSSKMLLGQHDSLGVWALAAAINADGCEIVFGGKQAIDDDNVRACNAGGITWLAMCLACK